MQFFIAVYEGSDWEIKAIPVWSEESSSEILTPEVVNELTGIDKLEMDGLSIYGPFQVPKESEV